MYPDLPDPKILDPVHPLCGRVKLEVTKTKNTFCGTMYMSHCQTIPVTFAVKPLAVLNFGG